MAMKWFWRLVCEPECSDACQVNCPGCRALADEWAEQGYEPRVTSQAPQGRFRGFRHAISCWSRSASAKMLARLNPVRLWRRDPMPVAHAGCGCEPATLSIAGSGAGEPDRIRGQVRGYYDLRARNVVTAAAGDGCCSTALPAEVSCAPQYAPGDLSAVPADAIVASLGCGNPFAHAELRPGEVVLDLGSGGGMDAFVAARKVGPDGHVFGLDMSDDMVLLAHRNAAAAEVSNVGFLKGDLEAVPLPRESVDVIISNCVVNLVPDKSRALREAFRVLRPGGRLSISDIVTHTPVPESLRSNLTAWAACIGGALSEDEYRGHLEDAGFVDIEIVRDREYTQTDADFAGITPILQGAGLAAALGLGFANTSVRARKPHASQANGKSAGLVPAALARD